MLPPTGYAIGTPHAPDPDTVEIVRDDLTDAAGIRRRAATWRWVVSVVVAAALLVRFGPPLWAFAAGAGLGLLEAAIANVHVGGVELGPEYSQVLPLLLVLVALALRPPREALEEVE